MAVHLTVSTPLPRGISPREMTRRARAMLRSIKRTSSELSIAFVDDQQIHELNKVYRHKDKATDVLAFAQGEGEFSALHPELLGDVIVSIPTTVRQARAAARPALDELTMLVAHGLLHLCGWDHETAAKDRAMRKETERLCAAAGQKTRAQRAQKRTGQTR
ncbi:rRNA maturation RNase YbeY [soil metagenome]